MALWSGYDDPDSGPNRLQNLLTLSVLTLTGINGSIQTDLDSEPGKPYVIGFYQTSACDESEYGGAEVWLSSLDMNTDANEDATETVAISLAETGGFLTATATHVDHGTSEFSLCLPMISPLVFEDGFEASEPSGP